MKRLMMVSIVFLRFFSLAALAALRSGAGVALRSGEALTGFAVLAGFGQGASGSCRMCVLEATEFILGWGTAMMGNLISFSTRSTMGTLLMIEGIILTYELGVLTIPLPIWGLAEVGNPTIRTSASTSVLAM